MVDPTQEDLPLRVAEAQDVRRYTMEAMKVLRLDATEIPPHLFMAATPSANIRHLYYFNHPINSFNYSEMERKIWKWTGLAGMASCITLLGWRFLYNIHKHHSGLEYGRLD